MSEEITAEEKLKIAMVALEDIKKHWDISDFECIKPVHFEGEFAPNDSLAAGSIIHAIEAFDKISQS